MEVRCDPLSSRKDIDSTNMFVHFVMYQHNGRTAGELGFVDRRSIGARLSCGLTDRQGASERRFHKHVEETSMGTMATTQDQRLATAGVATTTKTPLWRGLGFHVAVSMVLGIVLGLAWPAFATSVTVPGDISPLLINTA